MSHQCDSCSRLCKEYDVMITTCRQYNNFYMLIDRLALANELQSIVPTVEMGKPVSKDVILPSGIVITIAISTEIKKKPEVE